MSLDNNLAIFIKENMAKLATFSPMLGFHIATLKGSKTGHLVGYTIISIIG